MFECFWISGVSHVAIIYSRHALIGCAEIWLDWLKDEIGLTEGDEAEREKIYELFEKAVKDYICKCGSISIKYLLQQQSDSITHPIAICKTVFTLSKYST